MLVAFDLDGVLFGDNEVHYEALNMALRKRGHAEIAWEDHVTTFDGLPTVVKLERLGVTDPEVAPLKQEYTAVLLAHHSGPDPRLAELLDRIRAEGHTIAVVSNAVWKTVDTILAGRGFTVDHVVSNEDVTRPKPNPEPYLRAMIAAGVGPRETLAVEDSDYGVTSAWLACCSVVRVSCPDDVTWERLFVQPRRLCAPA